MLNAWKTAAGVTQADVAEWGQRTMPLLREVVEVAEQAVYSKLREASIVVDRLQLALGDKY